MTLANSHDSQMLPMLLDPENQDDFVWADSAYSGEFFEDLLRIGGFESCIHEKGTRNHPLSEAAKERNRIKSAIRACVEHVFGCMTTSMEWAASSLERLALSGIRLVGGLKI